MARQLPRSLSQALRISTRKYGTIMPRFDMVEGNPDWQNPRWYSSTDPSLLKLIPADSWDSHMHVVSKKYPFAQGAQYEPHEASLEEASRTLARVPIKNMVLVQPSIYGNDNSCLLEALRKLGSKRGRGVVQFDPRSVSEQQLREWHDLGVRGVRVNLKSTGTTMSTAELEILLQRYADRIRDLDWVLDLHVVADVDSDIHDVIAKLDVKTCIDHLGYLRSPMGYDTGSLLHLDRLVMQKLMRSSRTYLKLSAPYRLIQPQWKQILEGVVMKMLRKGKPARDRLVFASDWPHTRFEGFDVLPFVEQCVTMCGKDPELVRAVFRDNARTLWDVKD